MASPALPPTGPSQRAPTPTAPTPAVPAGRATYEAAGVSLDAADEVVRRIAALAESTSRIGSVRQSAVLPNGRQGRSGPIGGFASAFLPNLTGIAEPVILSSTDGVGTKLAVAAAAGKYGTLGIDLVAMCVDDLACAGAEPLFFLDYISVSKLDPGLVEEVVGGIAEGCRTCGCTLVGGETAEHPGETRVGRERGAETGAGEGYGAPARRAVREDHGIGADPDAGDGGTARHPELLDMAGFAVGIADRSRVLGPDKVMPGDALVGLESPGLRSNGYSLARHVFFGLAGMSLDDPAFPGARRSLADELLLPSVIYAPALLELGRSGAVHAAAHITGGGIPGNVPRALPSGCDATIDLNSWEVPRIFTEIRRLGSVADQEMLRVFNLGIGMILSVDPGEVETVVSIAQRHSLGARAVGVVTPGSGAVRFERAIRWA